MTVSSTTWPEGRPFALFLSHDVDQIHDRELFRVLADLNHVRRIWTQVERGRAALALRRVARALVAPKPAEKDFATILEIEARHGFRSTFFVLHDPYWSRHGPRYRLACPEIRRIAALVRGAGCEIGLHGGFLRFNQADGYRESREALRAALGVDAVGIRNHFLRFSGADTWAAQEAAGFRYDATFGFVDRLGPRAGRIAPFVPEGRSILELPLTVMDVTLFRNLGLTGEAALDAAWQALEPVAQAGGLVTLLWHNNYFNEPEYRDWQWTYEQLLERLAALNPWCATGAEIERWCRANAENSALAGAGTPV
ncbi:MAG: polysaccharide deacetylase family protein [Kiritimatiellia bacterium]